MIQSKLPDYFLVNPRLQDDPFEKKGQIGLLVYGYEKDDLYFLRFEDREIYSYQSKDMLVFRPKDEILTYLETHGSEIARSDFNALYNITLFLDYGNFDNQKKALELARSSETVTKAGMTSLGESLERSNRLRTGR